MGNARTKVFYAFHATLPMHEIYVDLDSLTHIKINPNFTKH